MYSFLTHQENKYVYFIINDKAFNLVQLIIMCLIPLAISIVVYFKSRKLYKYHTTSNTYDIILYMCSIVSICLLSIINFIYVFLNTFYDEDSDVLVINIIPDQQQYILFNIIVPLSVLLIFLSILLKIILYKHNRKSDSYHFDICIMFNVINLIVCYSFSQIFLFPLILIGLIYSLF